jgi:hypothetical protein
MTFLSIKKSTFYQLKNEHLQLIINARATRNGRIELLHRAYNI